VYCVTAAADSSFTDVTGVPDEQTITWSANPTAGDFTVTCGTVTSAAIAGGAAASVIQTALRLIPELDTVNVVETSSTLLTLTNSIATDGDLCTVTATLASSVALTDATIAADVQDITWSADPTRGDYTVTCGAATSAAIAAAAAASVIQTALRLVAGLTNITVADTDGTHVKLTGANTDGDVCLVTVDGTAGTALDDGTTAVTGTSVQATLGVTGAVTAVIASVDVGRQNTSYDFIEHNATANTVVVERLIGVTTTMLQYTYDSTDSFNIAGTTGASEAEFEAAMHASTEADNEEFYGAYRILTTGTGISSLVLG
jgi:hypothetical protein